MKKLTILAAFAMLLVAVVPALAVKPSGKLAGAEKVSWNLSADVMPVPPYGSRDILGSDTASKLIVNQPNGAVEVTITGAMNGLNPNTIYTVYLSNGYTPYADTGWDVTGDDWVISVDIGGTIYPEDTVFVQLENSIPGPASLTGSLLYATSLWIIDDGSVIGNAIHFQAYYDPNPTRTVQFWGTIAPDGTMSGTWADDDPYTRSGTWASTSGQAVKTHTGNMGWPGLFTSTVPSFTFTTNEYGVGSWHVNLRNSDFSGANIYTLSVWINEAGWTILISDNFEVVVD